MAEAGSTVTVTRAGDSSGAFDYETLSYENPDAAVEVYEGPAIVRPVNQVASEIDAADQQVTQGRWEVKIPDLTATFAIDDHVAVTASIQDPGLAGVVLTVKHIPQDDWVVSRRLICEEDRT